MTVARREWKLEELQAVEARHSPAALKLSYPSTWPTFLIKSSGATCKWISAQQAKVALEMNLRNFNALQESSTSPTFLLKSRRGVQEATGITPGGAYSPLNMDRSPKSDVTRSSSAIFRGPTAFQRRMQARYLVRELDHRIPASARGCNPARGKTAAGWKRSRTSRKTNKFPCKKGRRNLNLLTAWGKRVFDTSKIVVDSPLLAP